MRSRRSGRLLLRNRNLALWWGSDAGSRRGSLLPDHDFSGLLERGEDFPTTARETSPAVAHIPGAEQNQASLDVERFHAGIFRKESDLAVGSPTIKTLTQSQDLSPEGRVLLEYYSR
jgi:hypothetical protein